MRIVKLEETSKKNILADLLKRDPNQYTDYTDAVQEIVDCVKTEGDSAVYRYTKEFDKADMNKVAAMASNGVARTIRPVNTSLDGDSVYALATGKVKSRADVVGTLEAHVMGKAINRAVLETEEKYGYKSAQSFL